MNDTDSERKCPPHVYIIESVGELCIEAICEECDDRVLVSPRRSRDYKEGEAL